MSYQVLARKWRPRTFAALVGQAHVVNALTHALNQQRLHHAYLFTGTRGVGKTTLARILAKSLNCEAGVSASPCGECDSCREIDGGRFPDLLEVDAATNTRVDEMRQLLEGAVYAPTRGRFKVYVIDEVHMLSASAFNAMLKTLEEPPEHVKFILATTDPQKIPVTVLSRCLQFNLKQMPVADITRHLDRILEAEAVPFDASALTHVAHAASGSMRDALSLLDQAIAHGAGEVREAAVRDMLGTVDQDHLYRVLDALAGQDLSTMLAVADALNARSLSFAAALRDLAALLTRLQICQFAPEALEATPEESDCLQRWKEALSPEFVQLCYQIVVHGKDELPLAPDPWAGFVMTLMRMHAFRPDAGGSDGGGDVPRQVAKAPASRRVPPAATQKTVTEPAALPGGSDRVAETVESEGAGSEMDADPADRARSAAFEAPPPVAASKEASDWHRLIDDLGVGGMVRALAQHCELVSWALPQIQLRMAPMHRHLLVPANCDRLQAALSRHTSCDVRLQVDLSEPSGETPMQRAQQTRERRQQQAVEAIEKDPFVCEAIEIFDIRMDDNTIKPVQEQAR